MVPQKKVQWYEVEMLAVVDDATVGDDKKQEDGDDVEGEVDGDK